MKNPKWEKQGPQPAATEAFCVECDGQQLLSVMAAMRRQGRSCGEPIRAGPNRWKVCPGRADGEFVRNPYGLDDAATFNTSRICGKPLTW